MQGNLSFVFDVFGLVEAFSNNLEKWKSIEYNSLQESQKAKTNQWRGVEWKRSYLASFLSRVDRRCEEFWERFYRLNSVSEVSEVYN